MKYKYFGRERVCKSLIDTKVEGKSLNIGAGQLKWIENDLFNGYKEFYSSDIDQNNLGSDNLAKNKVKMSAEKIPFKSGYFSQVIILDVLEHIKDHEKVLDEIFRVLKKEGKLVICVPNDTLLSFLNPIRYTQHERHYTVKHITYLLNKNGFNIKKIFVGGRYFDLASLYLHLFYKHLFGKKKNFLNKLRDREYSKHIANGNEIAILALKK